MAIIKRNGVTYGGNGTINLAPQYSKFATYAVDEYAIFDGLLRKCITPVTTPEEFDPTKWTIVSVTDELNDKIDISNLVSVTNTGDVYIGTQLIRKVLTQNEYDALTTKDPKVDYCIIETT